MSTKNKFALRDFADGIEIILRNPEIKTVTVFCSPLKIITKRVRITRMFYNSIELRVTAGKPNFAEREYIKLCKKAKCNPRRLWLKFFKKK